MRARTLWRALEQARGGTGSGRRVGDGITRRRVLAGLAAGAGLAAAGPSFGQGRGRPRSIAIVGGGLAGLSALHHLQGSGVQATLYEARAAVGGRTRSVRDIFAPGTAIDEGAQLVNSDHDDLKLLIGELGLRLVNRDAVFASREVQIDRSGRVVPEAELARALAGIAATIAADADRLDNAHEAVARELDPLSVADYLDRYRLAAGPARDLIEAGIRTEYGAEPHEASALELLFNLPTVDGARVNRLSLSDEVQLVEGGTGQIAAHLGERHARDIRLGMTLQGITIGPAQVVLSFDGGTVEADRVILALPAGLLRELRIEGPLPPLWREAFGAIGLGRVEKLLVGHDSAPWLNRIGFGGAIWSPEGFAEAWHALSNAPVSGPSAFAYLLGGAQVEAAAGRSMADLAAAFTTKARGAVPDLPAPNGRLRRTAWTADPLSRGAYVNFRPGQLTRFASLLTLDEDGESVRPSQAGPLLLAGEWVSDAFQGYMNGAVQTGRIAAAAALRPVVH